jgi:hypothetical protein
LTGVVRVRILNAMAHRISQSNTSLISDITPWWWVGSWEEGEAGLVGRVFEVLSSMRDGFEEIRVARGCIEVRFAVDDNAERLHDRADALRTILDELVTSPHAHRAAAAAN